MPKLCYNFTQSYSQILQKVIFLKQWFKTLAKIFNDSYFIIPAALAFLLPDIQLRGLVDQNVFSESYVGPATWGFSLLWVSVILFVCIVILPKKSGRITYIISNSVFIILSLCQYVYFKIFDQFFWLKSIALAGEGAEYLSFALKYVDLKLLLCTGFAVLLMIFAAKRWQKPQKLNWKWCPIVILPILGITAIHILMLPQTFNENRDDWDSWRKPRVVYAQRTDVNKSFEVNGLYQMTFRDIYNTCFAPDKYGKAEYKAVDDYFAQKGEPSVNDYTGLFKGKNVISVMLEGVDTWMVSKRYTPAICYMMENGFNFTNYYSPTFGTGHTFNAEFAFNTGYFSPLSAVSATTFSSNSFPYSVANLFAKEGYFTNSFHYNTSEFYNRGIMHKSFGYEAYNSFPDFGMPITVSQSDSNILKNEDIYKKMTEKQPFFDFVITYSGHVPYTFDDAKLALAKENHPDLVDLSMNPEKNNCLILAADTDDFFKQLLTRLENDGILDNTVIVVYTDHYAYGFSDQELLKSYKKDEIIYKVPAFIYAKGIEGKNISKPAQTIDFLPTLLNLFDIKTEARFIGNDILSPENRGFAYFGNGAWVDDKMYYVPSDKEPDPKDKEYIQAKNKRVQESFDITEIVVTGDYFANR